MSTPQLNISTRLCCANTAKTQVVCDITGITVSLDVPCVPGQVLEYTNPLAQHSNYTALIKQGAAYLRKLEPAILAGLMLAAYKHYGLIQAHTSAAEQNVMLRTAGAERLIAALTLSTVFTHQNTEQLPKLSLEWVTHKDTPSTLPCLQSYLATCKAFLLPGADQQHTVAVYAATRPSRYKKLTLSELEAEAIAELKEAKQRGKALIQWAEQHQVLAPRLLAFLRPLFSASNLYAMQDVTRAKVVAALEAYQVAELHELAILVRDTKNPYSIFAKMDDTFERASDSFETTARPKRSLKEILAAKKAGADSEPAEELKEAEAPEELEAVESSEDELDEANETWLEQDNQFYNMDEEV